MDKRTESSEVAPFTARTAGEYTSYEMGQFFAAGRYGGLNRAQSLRVAAGLSCYDVIAQDVSRTPLNLYRMTRNGPEKVLPGEHPVARLLSKGVNEWMGVKEWLRLTAFHLPIYQEATTLIRRRGTNEPFELYAHNPERCRVEVNTMARQYFYRITLGSLHDQVQLAWTDQMMPARDVMHFRGRTLDGLVALPSSYLGREVYDTLSHMRKFVKDMFERGGLDVFAFAFPEALTDQQFGRLQNGLKSAAKKAREDGDPVILEGADGEAPDAKSLTMTAADDDFVKTNEAVIKEACRLVRVPPHKIFALESVKYDNITEMDRIYVTDTLGMYFQIIEEVMGRRLLDTDADADLFLMFDRDAAYAMEPDKRAKIWRERWESGGCTYDEYRAGCGLKLVGGEAGKARMIKGAAVMIDGNNKVIMRSGKGDDKENTVPKEPGEEDKDAPHLRVVK